MKCQLLLKVDQNWTEGDKNEDFSIFLNIFFMRPFPTLDKVEPDIE